MSLFRTVVGFRRNDDCGGIRVSLANYASQISEAMRPVTPSRR